MSKDAFRNVTIENAKFFGIWDYEDFSSSFNTDLNFLIGENGTGKTTFLKAIFSVLSFDVHFIVNSQFTKCEIDFLDDKVPFSLKVNREYLSDDILEIFYKIEKQGGAVLDEGHLEINLNHISRNGEIRIRKGSNRYIDIENARKVFSSIFDIRFMSIARIKGAVFEEDEFLNANKKYNRYTFDNTHKEEEKVLSDNPYLNSLLFKIKDKLNNIDKSINLIHENFKNDCMNLVIMPFDSLEDSGFLKFEKKISDSSLGSINLNESMNFDYNLPKEMDLIKHCEMVRQFYVSGRMDEVVYRSELLRLYKFMNLFYKFGKDVDNIKDRFNTFLDVYNEFLSGKFVDFSESNEPILCMDDTEFYGIDELSSGEINIFILLAEYFLLDASRAIFIIDEPEISLHIKWQSRIIKALREIDSETQIIVATHSPDIVSKFGKKIVKLERSKHGIHED